MNAADVFQITTLVAGIGWILLLFASPFWGEFDKWVLGIVVALLALVYTWLNFANFHPDILKNFSSLQGVMKLFGNPELVDAAWVHILAFDLLAGVWIKKNSLSLGMSHSWILPALILTIPFGPLGYLIYLVTRWIKTKNYFSSNF